jgi:hypothetical protein
LFESYFTDIIPSGCGISPPICVISPKCGSILTVLKFGESLSIPRIVLKNSMLGLAPYAWQSDRVVSTSESSPQGVSPSSMPEEPEHPMEIKKLLQDRLSPYSC